MNQKKSKKIIIIAIIIVLILTILAGVAYAYLETDFLKSNKKLFFKYISQTADSENGFIENQMKEYFEKRKDTPYTTDGSFSVEIQGPEEIAEQVSNTNNMDITFSGQVDTVSSKLEQDISINYSNKVKFPFSFRKIGDTMGIQTQYVGSKYITLDATDTENINTTSENSGTSTATISIDGLNQGVEKLGEVSNIEFSQEELQHVKDTYLAVLDQNLQNSNFKKVSEAEAQGYQLSLTSEELKNIEIKLLETLKNDHTTLDKLNEYAQLQSSSNQITQNDIDEMIEEINNQTDENANIEISVYQKDGQVTKIAVENEESKIVLEKIKTGNDLQYNISLEKITDGQTEGTIYLNARYSGLQMMQAVNENYELGIEFIQSNSQNSMENTMSDIEEQETNADLSFESEIISYQYSFNNNVEFQETSDIEDFTQSNSLNLNSLEEEQKNNFINAVVERLTEVNKKQMGELGLAENENPIIYMLPTLYIYNSASSVIQNSNDELSQMEVSTFNNKFEQYQGTNLMGATVKGLLTTIATNNGLNDDEDEMSSDEALESNSGTNKNKYLIEEINFNGDEYEVNRQNIALIKEEIVTEDRFRVDFEKDEDTGRIYRVVINKK